MAKRPTIDELARVAGVSVATVDRVLNRRLPVRPETARRVFEAANRIGFHATGLIGQRLREDLPEVKLGFLLLKAGQQFYSEFARELERAALAVSSHRCLCTVDFAGSQAPDEVLSRVEALSRRAQALAVVAPEHPSLTALVESLKARGVPVFALLSDFAAGVRHAYVGLDNGKSGRTAAWTIANCAPQPGKVALFVGSHRFHGHELREIAFRSYFRERAPEFTVLDTLVNLETRQLTHDALVDLQARHPDLVGAYVAGGGMEGAISALRAMPPETRPVAVCHEITPESRAALAETLLTMIIATPLARLCAELVNQMVHAVSNPETASPSQVFLPFDVFLPENV
ncbi:MAG: LacI family transcriptional regulator [Mesorhizobium amorphae]|nr:MAG: LacI family transcriptional regulator [Mesorhizobium amorphae]